MSYQGLLAFIAVAVAIYRLADPAQRISAEMFVQWRWLVLGAAFSFIALLANDLSDRGVSLLPPASRACLSAAALIVPVLAMLQALAQWRRAALDDKSTAALPRLIRTGLLEGRSDEIERVIQRNAATLHALPSVVLDGIFDRHLIRAFLRARSMLHLDLLSRPEVLEAVKPPFDIADRLIRELLDPDLALSPLRFEVLDTLSRKRTFAYDPIEGSLFERTFGEPTWYTATAAHRPLLFVGIEALHSARLDDRYNAIGRAYEAQEGRPERATCPLYLTLTAQCLAIEAAIDGGFEGELYVTNLWWLFDAVLRRSVYRPQVWTNSEATSAHPTPYAFVLHEIVHRLERLSQHALEKATTTDNVPLEDQLETTMAAVEGRSPRWPVRSPRWTVLPPGRIAQQLALAWSFCTAAILTSDGKVSDRLREGLANPLIYLLIDLHSEPSRIFHGAPPIGTPALDAWRDLFLGRLRERLQADANEVDAPLHDLLDHHLDLGRANVIEGRNWLMKELGLD